MTPKLIPAAFPDNGPHGVTLAPRHTYIARLILGMKKSLNALGVQPTPYQLEKWAIFIHESMSTSSRNYHSVKHVFDLADGWDDPIGVLSAYFHDAIYYHVDGELSPSQQVLLEHVFDPQEGKAQLACAESCRRDPQLQMVHSIFGFTPGQKIGPSQGLNEFLSAVAAVRELGEVLPIKILAQITCCIEATIPFRSDSPNGETPMDRLYDRMVLSNNKFHLGLTDQELIESVQRAATLANRDVGNFGSTDIFYFLDNTWSLLPEINESLRHQYLYTVEEFQQAVFKMHGFFSFIRPSIIFVDYQGLPDNKDALTKQAERNLIIGKKYVTAKLLSISVIAAFAKLTGGDAPMSLFMGDLPSRHHVSCRIEDYLPEPYLLEKCDRQVYDILQKGRKTETSFDIRQSPLAAFLYGCMGDDGIFKVAEKEKWFPMDENKAQRFLRCLPRECVISIAQNMANVAVSRADDIDDIIIELQSEAVSSSQSQLDI